MQPDVPSRKRASKIKDGCFAAVIRSFMSKDNPKWMKFAHATRDLWGRQLKLAERPEILGAVSIYELRSSLVQAFLDGLADRPATQVAALSALRALEKWALVRDILPYPITIGCEAEGSDDGHIPWGDEHVALGEAHAKPALSRAITLAANTGQRGSDLVKMRANDIEVYDGRPGINVTQKKTGNVIWIPMTQPLIAAMATWERRPGPILIKADGQPWTRKQLTGAWSYERDSNPDLAPLRSVAAEGIEARPLVMHGLCATACVRLLRAGCNTRQIADMVGKSEPMVIHYTRFASQRANAMAAVFHLDRTQGKPSDRSRERTGG